MFPSLHLESIHSVKNNTLYNVHVSPQKYYTYIIQVPKELFTKDWRMSVLLASNNNKCFNEVKCKCGTKLKVNYPFDKHSDIYLPDSIIKPDGASLPFPER